MKPPRQKRLMLLGGMKVEGRGEGRVFYTELDLKVNKIAVFSRLIVLLSI